jgi:hypothetical protein
MRLVTLVLALLTVVHNRADRVAVIRSNQMIVAFTDGMLCYGTYAPREPVCHKAVPKPTYKEIK